MIGVQDAFVNAESISNSNKNSDCILNENYFSKFKIEKSIYLSIYPAQLSGSVKYTDYISEQG